MTSNAVSGFGGATLQSVLGGLFKQGDRAEAKRRNLNEAIRSISDKSAELEVAREDLKKSGTLPLRVALAMWGLSSDPGKLNRDDAIRLLKAEYPKKHDRPLR